MGKHAASGSDGLDQGHAPVAAGRRRTDALDSSWPGFAADLSDHPTARGRARSERREVLLGAPSADVARQPRPRLPLPPVPASARPAAAPGSRASSPSRPVPVPEQRVDRPVPARHVDVPAAVSAGLAPTGARADDELLVTTGPGSLRSARPAPLVPRVPRRTTPTGAPASSYGDWTKPSRADADADCVAVAVADFDADADRGRPQALVAPGTTAIPERRVGSRRDADRLGDPDVEADVDMVVGVDEDEDRPALSDSDTGSVRAGRAAYRAERQAADSVRRKAARRNGEPDVVLDEDEHRSGMVLKSLVAMVVVALAVLGVYTVTKPAPIEPVAQTATPETAAPVAPPVTAELPPLADEPITLAPETTATVRAPVTVLNATGVTGLAGRISAAVVAGGWESAATGPYPGTDVATTTVFYTDGDEQQRQAAEQLVEQFPDITGLAVRFFDVPGVAAPGLVIVATGDWQP